MNTPEPAIYIVVAQNDKTHRVCNGHAYTDDGGPLVFEQYTRQGSLAETQQRAAGLERRYGACRIARLVFEDHPAFNEGTE